MTAAPLFPAPVPPGLLADPELSGGNVLLTSEATGLLAAAVQPATLESARCHQVVCRFGDSLTVSYECLLSDETGGRRQRLIVARAGGRMPSKAAVISDGTDRLSLWVFPDDPYLPGLAEVLDQGRLAAVLAGLGVGDPPTHIQVRSYLPARRAVVEVETERARLFIKVVRPHTAGRLRDLNNRIAQAVPIPPILGESDASGLIIMEAMEGLTLWEHLAASKPGPNPARIVDLLDKLPVLEGGPQPQLKQVRNHARLLSLLAPDRSNALEGMVGVIEQARDEPQVPVHGDLHSGQIIIESSEPKGLIDVDRAGAGSRADDLAGLLAHLTVGGFKGSYLADLWEAFDRMVDPVSLRLRTAASVLGFAPWSFVAQQADWPAEVRRRIDLAAMLTDL